MLHSKCREISWDLAGHFESGHLVIGDDDVIKWKHFPRYWPFVRGIQRSPVNSPHKCQWRGALMFSLICARINGWVNKHEADDLRRHGAHYDVTVMYQEMPWQYHCQDFCRHRGHILRVPYWNGNDSSSVSAIYYTPIKSQYRVKSVPDC